MNDLANTISANGTVANSTVANGSFAATVSPSSSMSESLNQLRWTVAERCTEAAQRIGKPLLFGMTTSLMLQAVPLPSSHDLEPDILHTVASSHRQRIRSTKASTQAHVWRNLDANARVRINKHVYALDLMHTWAQLANHTSLESLVILGDAIITAISKQPSLRHGRDPDIIYRDMAELVTALPRFNAKPACMMALPLIRPYVDSPKESECRLTLAQYGVPQPAIQHVVPDVTFRNGTTVTLDMAWPEFRVALEYDGDQHRTDKAQWRRDQEKRERLRHHNWAIIIATAANLADEPSRAELAYLVARQLALRGAECAFRLTAAPIEQVARIEMKAQRC